MHALQVVEVLLALVDEVLVQVVVPPGSEAIEKRLVQAQSFFVALTRVYAGTSLKKMTKLQTKARISASGWIRTSHQVDHFEIANSSRCL